MVILSRDKDQSKQTTGDLLLENGRILKTVELKWNNNKRRESCIPTGEYDVVPRTSQKYGKHFYITNVPGRDLCLFHAANYSRQLLGCIAPGLSHKDIDKDGLLDVVSSKLAMQELLTLYPNGFKLRIQNKP